jgi:hypothetical protein
MAALRFTLVRSRLAGDPAHYDQLRQLLEAPDAYWKAQTPVGFRPVKAFALDPARDSFTELTLGETVTSSHLRTLLVLMAARMPGLSIEFAIEGDPGGWAGLRLVRGKLEGRREGTGPDSPWGSIPHHSTWIGQK